MVRIPQTFAVAIFAASAPTWAAAERFEAQKIIVDGVVGAVIVETNNGSVIDVDLDEPAGPTITAALDEAGVLRIRGPLADQGPRRPGACSCCDADRALPVPSALLDEPPADPDAQAAPSDAGEASAAGEADEAAGGLNDPLAPTVRIAAPRAVDLTIVNAEVALDVADLDGDFVLDVCAVYGEVGSVENAVIDIGHASRLVVGNVGAFLNANVSGDADLLTGDLAEGDIAIAGPGDVTVGDVDGPLDISIAGRGVLQVARLLGALDARIAGPGRVAVQRGRADPMKATIDGRGEIDFAGTAVSPTLRLYGRSTVRVDSLVGDLDREGPGAVLVGDDERNPDDQP
ncbi:MAG: hypothetical protein AAGC56_14750 [Pseudomonadota bacterium]